MENPTHLKRFALGVGLLLFCLLFSLLPIGLHLSAKSHDSVRYAIENPNLENIREINIVICRESPDGGDWEVLLEKKISGRERESEILSMIAGCRFRNPNHPVFSGLEARIQIISTEYPRKVPLVAKWLEVGVSASTNHYLEISVDDSTNSVSAVNDPLFQYLNHLLK